ncbi:MULTISPECIES: hypothetical protein [Aquimarina]|uniref:hypothetical protein n=1 Tax=Aquimarina TaxID=290174 RepID=UPI0009448BCA|nr:MULTISPECIES: hypothetical protein [Aquimarina]
MKKTIFKVITILTLAIFISSCETDDGIESKLENTSSSKKNEENNNLETKSSSNVFLLVTSIDGPYDTVDGVRIPKIGSYVNISGVKIPSGHFYGTWDVKLGGYEIVKRSSQSVRLKRVTKEDAIVFFFYTEHVNENGNIVLKSDIATYGLSAIPDPVPCPTSEHTKMRQSFSKYAAAINYDERYTYNWTVVNKGNTYTETGRNVRLRGFGNFNVTLTIAQDGCTTQTRTQNFYVNIGR